MAIERITEHFYNEGYRGAELMKMVYMTGYVGALMTENEEAAKYFSDKYDRL